VESRYLKENTKGGRRGHKRKDGQLKEGERPTNFGRIPSVEKRGRDEEGTKRRKKLGVIFGRGDKYRRQLKEETLNLEIKMGGKKRNTVSNHVKSQTNKREKNGKDQLHSKSKGTAPKVSSNPRESGGKGRSPA